MLGKKSWNVYNADNIAKVRRDEAAAKAAEEAEEQRMQEIDAQRRLAILRGEAPPPMEDNRIDEQERIEEASKNSSHPYQSGSRKKRKRYGEDDTDFELRLAKERIEPAHNRLETSAKPTSSAPIVDTLGHIDLFGDERSRAHAEKNEEAEKESYKKKREYEDQYTMRLSNAAGRDGIKRPWYSQKDAEGQNAPLKDVWGNDDPNRKERDTQRINSNDPLAMMKKGASKVRELKQERRKFQEERDEELRQMRREDRHRERRRRRHDSDSRHRSRSPRSVKRRQSRDRLDERGRDQDHGEERRHRESRKHRSVASSSRRLSYSPDGRARRHRYD